jgi:transcriptional regulator with XRE-family HTH domain
MAHGDCFVQGKALAPILGGQDVIARTLTAKVGKLIGINGDAYGRYERGEVRPTIEMAIKIADALEVSLDYLAGKTDMEIDDITLRRMQEVAKMSEKDKDYVFTLLDAFIARTRLQGLV